MKAWILCECDSDKPFTVPSDCNLMPTFWTADDAVDFHERLPAELSDRLVVKAVEL